MKEHRITIRITSDLRRRLQQAARHAGTRPSDLVRAAIERSLAPAEESPSAYDVFKRAGLIGALKNAPRDLSVNRKHFDGFGAS